VFTHKSRIGTHGLFQLTCRCYEDAGNKYRPSISKRQNEFGGYGEVEGHSLLRQVIQWVKSYSNSEFRSFSADSLGVESGAEIAQSDEELAAELLQELRDEYIYRAKGLDRQLVVAAHEFSQAMYTAKTRVRVEHNEFEDVIKLHMSTLGLRLLLVEGFDFVTTGDLLNHCLNLPCDGEICI